LLKNWRRSLLPRATEDGNLIRYEISGLGAPSVAATAYVLDSAGREIAEHDITEDMKRRQSGDDRPFAWGESGFDSLTGSYANNPRKRNWAGSDLSGGTQIGPGGIGDVTVPCTDWFDCISKEHDIRFWLAANFGPGCMVGIKMENGIQWFQVKPKSVINVEAVLKFIKGYALPRPRHDLDA
jgi:hypothetical protein